VIEDRTLDDIARTRIEGIQMRGHARHGIGRILEFHYALLRRGKCHAET
jgi:hypothetical protein